MSAADFLLPREEEAARRTSEQLSERTESLDEVAVAEDVAEEHLDGPEQPQASKPADWRGPRVPRSRLGSDDQAGNRLRWPWWCKPFGTVGDAWGR